MATQAMAALLELDASDVVLTPYAPGRGLPLFIQPACESLRTGIDTLVGWFSAHRPALDALLLEHGALVLRGFAIEDTAAFSRVIAGFQSPDFGYLAGASPRAQLADRVFEATSAPAEAVLGMHQEMAYLPHYPARLAFYCRMPSVSGGETFLADMRAVTANVDPAFADELERRGVRYVRNFRAPDVSTGHPWLDSFHKTWTEAFSTSDPDKAEADCHAMGLTPQWLDNGSLAIAYVGPAFINHPATGERLWFNQVATQTLSSENTGDRFALYERHYGTAHPRPYATSYGDGTPIPAAFVSSLYPVLAQATVAFSWSHGDLLLIDNFRTAHGRNAYTGRRDVQVALLN